MKVAVGIDVSKAKLDVAVLDGNEKYTSLEFPNTAAGHKRLLAQVRKLAKGQELHFCMEVTAAYHYQLALFLVEAGELVSVENPRRVKHFGVAQGATQKTDRADARVIAHYARVMQPGKWRLAEPCIRELVMLDRRITDLHLLKNQERNRMEYPCLPKLVLKGIEDSLKAFDKQIKALEARIQEILQDSAQIKRQVELLSTIPGIATRAAVGLLAEVGDLEAYPKAEDLAAKLGLNPVHRRSGTSLHGRTRISKAGNAHARSRLYMPTIVAIHLNPPVREFYNKLLANHKPKKAALLAAERKLVMICFGVLKSGKPFQKNYNSLTS